MDYHYPHVHVQHASLLRHVTAESCELLGVSHHLHYRPTDSAACQPPWARIRQQYRGLGTDTVSLVTVHLDSLHDYPFLGKGNHSCFQNHLLLAIRNVHVPGSFGEHIITRVARQQHPDPSIFACHQKVYCGLFDHFLADTAFRVSL